MMLLVLYAVIILTHAGSLKINIPKNDSPFAAFETSSSLVEIGKESFEINKIIEHGSFGTVYEATHQRTNKKVAIKLILDAPKASDRYKLAKKERHFLQLLTLSTNIVDLICSEHKSKSVAIVMEYCSHDLFQYLVTLKEHHVAFVNSYTLRSEFIPFLSESISQLRSYGIVHFDLKPENILKCGKSWKITDFDAAETVNDGETGRISVRGTDGYTVPHVLHDQYITYSDTSDLYSVGAILHFLATGGFFATDKYDTHPGLEQLDVDLKTFIEKLLSQEFSLEQFYSYVHQLTSDEAMAASASNAAMTASASNAATGSATVWTGSTSSGSSAVSTVPAFSTTLSGRKRRRSSQP